MSDASIQPTLNYLALEQYTFRCVEAAKLEGMERGRAFHTLLHQTPAGFYNFLHRHPKRGVILDALKSVALQAISVDVGCTLCHEAGLVSTPVEDVQAFGENTWVYCGSHLRPHLTGWCTVGVDNKLGLGIIGSNTDEKRIEATRKCERLGLTLYKGDSA